VLVGKRKIKNPLGRRRTLGDNIKVDDKETRPERMQQINFAQKIKKVAKRCEDCNKWPGFRKGTGLRDWVRKFELADDYSASSVWSIGCLLVFISTSGIKEIYSDNDTQIGQKLQPKNFTFPNSCIDAEACFGL